MAAPPGQRVPASEERLVVASGLLDHEELDPFITPVAPALTREITLLGLQPLQSVVGAVDHFSDGQRDSVLHILSFQMSPHGRTGQSGSERSKNAVGDQV